MDENRQRGALYVPFLKGAIIAFSGLSTGVYIVHIKVKNWSVSIKLLPRCAARTLLERGKIAHFDLGQRQIVESQVFQQECVQYTKNSKIDRYRKNRPQGKLYVHFLKGAQSHIFTSANSPR